MATMRWPQVRPGRARPPRWAAAVRPHWVPSSARDANPGPGRSRHRARQRIARARLRSMARAPRLNRQNSTATRTRATRSPSRMGQAPPREAEEPEGQPGQPPEHHVSDLHLPSSPRWRLASSSYTYARAVLAGTPAAAARALAAAPAASRWP